MKKEEEKRKGGMTAQRELRRGLWVPQSDDRKNDGRKEGRRIVGEGKGVGRKRVNGKRTGIGNIKGRRMEGRQDYGGGEGVKGERRDLAL